jgi:hypothetical protein
VISPAGFEHFFREMAELAAAGPPQPADVMALADRYGLQFGRPDWLPDLIARYPPHPAARRLTAPAPSSASDDAADDPTLLDPRRCGIKVARAVPGGAGYPGRGGGLWLRMVLPVGLVTWLVPSG